MEVINRENIDWKSFKEGNFAINFHTEDEIVNFLNECDKNNIYWNTGDKATKYNYFYELNSNLCHSCEGGKLGYCGTDYYENKGIALFKWEVIDKVGGFGQKTKEMINHPSHYNKGKYEAIEVIEDWQLNFNLGNTVKYIARAGHKDNIIQDLKKSLWYLDREIKRLDKGE